MTRKLKRRKGRNLLWRYLRLWGEGDKWREGASEERRGRERGRTEGNLGSRQETI